MFYLKKYDLDKEKYKLYNDCFCTFYAKGGVSESPTVCFNSHLLKKYCVTYAAVNWPYY